VSLGNHKVEAEFGGAMSLLLASDNQAHSASGMSALSNRPRQQLFALTSQQDRLGIAKDGKRRSANVPQPPVQNDSVSTVRQPHQPRDHGRHRRGIALVGKVQASHLSRTRCRYGDCSVPYPARRHTHEVEWIVENHLLPSRR
jgi:hypothetical protein